MEEVGRSRLIAPPSALAVADGVCPDPWPPRPPGDTARYRGRYLGELVGGFSSSSLIISTVLVADGCPCKPPDPTFGEDCLLQTGVGFLNSLGRELSCTPGYRIDFANLLSPASTRPAPVALL